MDNQIVKRIASLEKVVRVQGETIRILHNAIKELKTAHREIILDLLKRVRD